MSSGAADWAQAPRTGKIYRRWSSILIDNRFAIDFTKMAPEMLPEGCSPKAIVYTHSHPDHYDPKAAVKLGVKHVFLHRSWLEDARRDFEKAVAEVGGEMPVLHPVDVAKRFRLGPYEIQPLPANHYTGRTYEQALMYKIAKSCTGGVARLLYATDTSGIPVETAAFIGIDTDNVKPRPITGLVMEATMGVSYADNFRIFTHSSVATVAQIAHVLESTGCYRPRHGQKIWLTHIARTLHGTHREIAATAPAPLAPAYDGQEVVF